MEGKKVYWVTLKVCLRKNSCNFISNGPFCFQVKCATHGVDVIGIFQVGTVGESVAWTDTCIVRVNPDPYLASSLGAKSFLSVFRWRRAEEIGTPLLCMKKSL